MKKILKSYSLFRKSDQRDENFCYSIHFLFNLLAHSIILHTFAHSISADNAFRSLIVNTKRYARLADGNVRNF